MAAARVEKTVARAARVEATVARAAAARRAGGMVARWTSAKLGALTRAKSRR